MLYILDTYVNGVKRSLSLSEEVEAAQLVSATLYSLARHEDTGKWNARYAKARQREAAESYQAMIQARRAWMPRTFWDRLLTGVIQ